MHMDVLDQLQLRLGRADDQDFLRAGQHRGGAMVVIPVFRGPSAARRPGVYMQVLVRSGRMNDRFLNIVRPDQHDMGLGVIDPDDGVRS